MYVFYKPYSGKVLIPKALLSTKSPEASAIVKDRTLQANLILLCVESTMEALFTSTHIPNLQTKPLLKPSLPTSSQSSCWLCNSLPKKQFPKLRISNGSSHGLRMQALLHNETPSDGEDNMAESNGFGFFPGDIFSLSQVLFLVL